MDFTVEGAKSIAYLHENPMRVIDDIKAEFHHCITGGVIGTKPLNQLIAKEDDVTIIISDMTRFWMRQDILCQLLVEYLHDTLNIPFEQIAVVIALGTHRMNSEEDKRKLAGAYVYDHVSVTDHDCDSPTSSVSAPPPSAQRSVSIPWRWAEKLSASAVRSIISWQVTAGAEKA